MAFDKSKFVKQYKDEMLEHVQRLTDGILKLEKSPGDRVLLEIMMREAHTIKGSSVMMGYKRVSDIAHSMESGLERALKEEVSLTKDHCDVLLKCLDSIVPLLEDKIIWEAKGMTRPFVDDLCKEVTSVFADRLEAAVKFDKRELACPVPEVHSDPAEPEFKSRREEFAGAGESLRVDIDKLDKLVNLSGELTVAKVRLNELVKTLALKSESQPSVKESLGSIVKEFSKVDQNISLASSNLQEEVMKVRMIPISYLFDQFPRAMRDLARKSLKDVNIVMEGRDTHLDKTIIDEMKDPIMHILRNAVDHGIESTAERLRLKKPLAGEVLLKAFQAGAQVIIEVSDDGSGIDMDKVRKHALDEGLVTKEKLEIMTEDQVFQLLFLPGFSTKDEVTETSGRGVGLDVVREKLSKLKGTVEIESKRGAGTKFIMKMPLTLAITECLLVASGNDTFAIPIDSVIETIRIEPSTIRTVETREVITVKGCIMPLVRSGDIFALPTKGIAERKYFSVVILQAVEKRIALLVDELSGRQDIVSKALGEPLNNIKYISGAAILGDGRVILVVDVASIINSFEGGFVARRIMPQAPKASASAKKRIRTILLAEDAMSTAMLEKSILESAGFSVVIARDGREALEKSFQEKFDLVITDILMPRMDGFELTTALRKEKLYKDIPIIIVTTRESDADKRRGLECGADAYILKSEFTSEGLLNTIERLIG